MNIKSSHSKPQNKNIHNPPRLNGVHHVAYRCKDAEQTIDFYTKILGMEFQLAIAEDHVPSTGQYDPYMHIFLDAGNNNILAFFELPEQPEMGRDTNTPDWVQHIAFRLENLDALEQAKTQLEAKGISVIGPTHHGIFKSIYFRDPNGHRLELVADISTEEQMQKLKSVAPGMIKEWSRTKKAPRHAAWLHDHIKKETDKKEDDKDTI